MMRVPFCKLAANVHTRIVVELDLAMTRVALCILSAHVVSRVKEVDQFIEAVAKSPHSGPYRALVLKHFNALPWARICGICHDHFEGKVSISDGQAEQQDLQHLWQLTADRNASIFDSLDGATYADDGQRTRMEAYTDGY